MPRPNRIFTVFPSLPEKLAPLREIAMNLWWSWNLDAVDLFRRLDRDLWEQAGIPNTRIEFNAKFDAAAEILFAAFEPA